MSGTRVNHPITLGVAMIAPRGLWRLDVVNVGSLAMGDMPEVALTSHL